MGEREFPGRVENYTNAALVMGFVNLLWVLGLVLATLGFGALLLVGLVGHYAVRWLGRRVAEREAARAWPKPGSPTHPR